MELSQAGGWCAPSEDEVFAKSPPWPDEELPAQVVIHEGLVVRPGDTLVVLVPDSHADFPSVEKLGDQIKSALPRGAGVVVLRLDSGSSIAVVRKDEVDV